MEWWLSAASVEVEHLVPIAAAAEEAGFGGIALGDHLVFPDDIASLYPYAPKGEVKWSAETPWPDPWVSFASMAAVTSRLRFTTAVYVAPLRDPVSLAKQTSTASVLSQGRVTCGFGSGWMKEEFDVVGLDFEQRGIRFDEMLQVLRLLWSGRMVEFHGRFYDFGPVQMSPAAVGGRIPVLLGGHHRRALERAVQYDGWIGVYKDIASTEALIKELCSLRSSTDKNNEPFEVATVVIRGAAHAAPLADVGVDTAIIPVLGLGGGTEAQGRVDAILRFGEEVIRP